MKIFSPDIYQKGDSWFIGYRRYHEVWLPGGRREKCWVNAEPEAQQTPDKGGGNG